MCLRVAERDLPERDEGNEAEPPHAAKRDHAEQERERAGAILAGRRSGHSRFRREAREKRHRGEQQCRDHQTGHRQQQPSREAERQHERRRDRRPERVAEVAADREEAHPARAPQAACIGRELGALRVVRGHAEPGDDDEEQHERVRGRRGRHSDADPGDRHSGREQPERAALVGPEAEERLDDRGRHRRSEHERRRKRVREPEAVDEERQQRRKGAVREVSRQMPGRESRHRPLVECLGPSHGPNRNYAALRAGSAGRYRSISACASSHWARAICRRLRSMAAGGALRSRSSCRSATSWPIRMASTSTECRLRLRRKIGPRRGLSAGPRAMFSLSARKGRRSSPIDCAG